LFGYNNTKITDISHERQIILTTSLVNTFTVLTVDSNRYELPSPCDIHGNKNPQF